MNFVFYYPAQYRGKDDSGNPLKLANCGMFAMISALPPVSMCGGLTQKGLGLGQIGESAAISRLTAELPDFMLVGGQRDRGRAREADPIAFGVVNVSSSRPASSLEKCWPDLIPWPTPPPPPSPPPSPPSPLPPPSSPPFPPWSYSSSSGFLVLLRLVAAGSVDSFDEAARSSLRRRIARTAEVPVLAVTLLIEPASVLITATISVPTQAEGFAVSSRLSVLVGNSTAASSLLEIVLEAEPVLQVIGHEASETGSADRPYVIFLSLLVAVANLAAFAAICRRYVVETRKSLAGAWQSPAKPNASSRTAPTTAGSGSRFALIWVRLGLCSPKSAPKGSSTTTKRSGDLPAGADAATPATNSLRTHTGTCRV